MMDIRVGCELTYDCPQPTPNLLMVDVHFNHVQEMVEPNRLAVSPYAKIAGYRDGFGNWCRRLEMPAGRTTIQFAAMVRPVELLDPVISEAQQHSVMDLPEDALVFLLASRYCETDLLMDIAWKHFGNAKTGWARVQAICDFVHNHIKFDYMQARPTRTAFEAYNEKVGVCRDYAHLAVAFCRCLNIPARYCTGYLGDMGTLPPYGPMDFAGWFEVYLSGKWHTFDARNNIPRIGRILIARGRDATDVAISTTFGPNTLVNFKVVCEEATAPT